MRAALLGLALVCGALPAHAQPRAGAAAAEIAAPRAVPLAGYGARGPGNTASGVLEAVSARALVLEDAATTRVGIVVLDALIVTPDLRDAIAAASADLELETLVVAATHTHSGPGGYLDDRIAGLAILGWYREASREALLDAAARALRGAAAALQPARFAHATADGTALARNRRHDGGPQDPAVPVLVVERSDGQPIATLFALAAHPTVLGPGNDRISPDYPGAARRRVEELRGGTALFLAGPLGDQKPHLDGEPEWPDDLERQAQTARRLGEALGERVAAAAANAQPAAHATLRAAQHVWRLPPIDVKASCAGYVGAPLLWMVARRWFPDSASLVALRVGDLRILASPFELGVEVAADVRRAAGAGPILVAAHAGGWLGYLLSPDDYDRGGYEPCLAYHGRDLAPRFVEHSRAVLDALRDDPER